MFLAQIFRLSVQRMNLIYGHMLEKRAQKLILKNPFMYLVIIIHYCVFKLHYLTSANEVVFLAG